jgi:hypothetical protein
LLIINQTFLIDDGVLSEWLDWTKLVYIPEVISSGFFSNHRIFKIHEGGSEEGSTFSFQFLIHSNKYLPEIRQNFDSKYEPLLTNTFGEKVLFFRTILEEM